LLKEKVKTMHFRASDLPSKNVTFVVWVINRQMNLLYLNWRVQIVWAI